MSDYITFEAHIDPMPWGDKIYTVLHLPDDVVAALGNPKRVEGELNEHPINLAPTRAPVTDGAFLWAGKSLLRQAGLEPGDVFEARLRAADPDHVDTPTDVLQALRSAGKTHVWEALTPGKKRGLLHQIETAKRAETRVARITKLIADLR